MWSDDRAPLSAPATEPLSLSPNALLKNTENVNQSLQHRFLGFSIPFDAVIIIFIPGFFEYKNAVLWEICLDPCLKSFMLEHSVTGSKLHTSEDNDCVEHEREPKFSVYGRWQLEPLHLPRAANGIVPKNERGQADVWSEKCLPPRIVHLRLPRVFSIAKRLEVDSAPAMVGFEFRNGRSMPVFEGICQRRREKAGRREENE